jgi:3'(2'), 5'-bisphosphate nucleotidase
MCIRDSYQDCAMDRIPVDSLIEISLEAGNAIMDVYDSASDAEVEMKSDNSPLTLADRRSNDIICRGLEGLSPDYPVISEENKMVPYDVRKNFQRFWLVDPLDGTKEFIKRNGDFTVNIALIEGQTPVAGFVYAPVLGEMYWAVRGKGAFLRKGTETRAVTASEFRMSDPALRVVCSRSHLNPETQAFIDDLERPEKVSKGSSLKFLLLASGKAELYPRIAPTMEWDTAAAQCILEAAGGEVIEYTSGLPLKYNKEVLVNPHFIARAKLL